MIFSEIRHASDLYDKSLRLREQVLRMPLGLTLSAADLADEAQQWHFGLVEQGDLLAFLVVKPAQKPLAKLRQMAVAPAMQGRGLGRVLVNATEQFLRQRGFDEVMLDARETAIGFYQALGYCVDGDVFQQVGIPHRCMRKSLAWPVHAQDGS
ncbi:GNAT family N-acetyltransferase [Methylobacillus arboreus]|uniref:GNAT family N-acetyltransferase n=1 Tax=Methylobacillus arboreus TaxID=755170 RepID=UPI001E3A84FD|nr:GNAT family N-acetyltransferase [Methylobacillus arboreus]MCB5190838.1 GNAT family N-acetyltransferase [Methylobacillus arboreus]